VLTLLAPSVHSSRRLLRSVALACPSTANVVKPQLLTCHVCWKRMSSAKTLVTTSTEEVPRTLAGLAGAGTPVQRGGFSVECPAATAPNGF